METTNEYRYIKIYKTFAYSYTIPLFLFSNWYKYAVKSLLLNDLFRHIKHRIELRSCKITQFYASFCLSDFLKTKNNDIYEVKKWK